MSTEREKIERRVLDVVDGLVAELNGGAARRGATVDDALDRDLGLGSLERVELLLRLEPVFGVRLPDAVMAEAASPGDLVAALLAARPLPAEPAPAAPSRVTPVRPASGSMRPLVEARRWHVDADRAAEPGIRLERLAGTAARLAFAAYVTAWLLVTLSVLWVAVALAPSGRTADRRVRRWCRLALVLGGCRLRVQGLEHVPATGSAVFAANHASYVDVVALLAAIPGDFRFVAKRELTAYPVIGSVIRKVGHLEVERGRPTRSAAAAERISRALAEGLRLLVFPEGTFRRAPGLLRFRLGAFKAAVDRQQPVIPVGIRGTRGVLPAGTWLPHPGSIAVTIGVPIVPEGAEWPAMVRLRDRVRAEIASLSGESPVEPHAVRAEGAGRKARREEKAPQDARPGSGPRTEGP